MSRLDRALRRIARDLDDAGVRWALIGGLAVSARTEPRFTRDLDVAVAVTADADAEALVAQLRGSRYRILAVLEHTTMNRLATVRLTCGADDSEGVVIDLLFASSGIEPEIVDAAEPLEIVAGLTVPVARAGHLLAMKVLSRNDESRPQDLVDIRALVRGLAPAERTRAREATRLIATRGFSRERDVERNLAELLGDVGG